MSEPKINTEEEPGFCPNCGKFLKMIISKNYIRFTPQQWEIIDMEARDCVKKFGRVFMCFDENGPHIGVDKKIDWQG